MQNFPAQLVSMNQVYCSRNSFLSNEKSFYVIKKIFHMQCLLGNISTWNFKNLVEGFLTKLFLQFLLSFLVLRYSVFCIVEICHKLVSCTFYFMDVWKYILKTNSWKYVLILLTYLHPTRKNTYGETICHSWRKT